MRFSNKFISAVLVLVIIFSQGAIMPLAAESSGYSEEIEIIKALGIMVGDENGDFGATNNLTRAEFAQILTVMLKINDGASAKKNAWYFKTGDGTENQTIAFENVQKFTDVSTQHWAYKVINQITDTGYMIGTSESEFSPEEFVTINQVNKVLVNMLGYEAFAVKNGGYPAGYNYTASSIKLLKGINRYGETPILRGELAKMLCNMFDVEKVEVSHITDTGIATYVQTEKTFLESTLEIKKNKGNLTDTSVTGLYEESGISEGEVVVGGITYKVAKGVEYINEYIGKTVEIYYAEDEYGRKIIIYASVSDDTEEFVINIKDFVTVGNGKLKYLDNDKTEEIDIELMPVVIFNGTAQETIRDEMIKPFGNGSITAINTDGKGPYDMLVVEAYRTMFVKNIADGVIVNGLLKQGTDADATIDLSPENNRNTTIRYYIEGKNATLKDITTESILDIAVSSGEIKVKIVKNKITCVVSAVSDDVDGCFIYDNQGNSYRIAKDFVNSTTVNLPQAGNEYILYFNSFGEVAYAEANSTEYNNTALVIKASDEGRGLKKEIKVKLLTSTGRFDEYTFAEKVSFTNSEDETTKLTKADEVLNVISGLKEKIITYRLDENGTISAIKEPVAYINNQTRNPGRLGVLYETNTELQYTSGNNIDFRAYLTNETAVYSISSSKDVEDTVKYKVMTRTEFAKTPDLKISKVVAYNTDKNSPEATVVLAYNDAQTTYQGHMSKIELFVVDKIKNAVNSDGDNVVMLEGSFIAGNSQAQPKQQTYKSAVGAFSKMGAFIDNGLIYEVQKGDVIRCFEVDGDVKYATLVYRRSLDYALNGRFEKGAFAGINDGLMNSSGNSNPFVPRFTSNSFTLDGFTIWHGNTYANALSYKELRFADMFVLSVNERFITLTTQDLSDPSSIPDYYDSRYTIITAPIPNYITIQTKKGDNYTSSSGLFTQIKSYETNLNDCSRAVVQMYNGLLTKLIILNEE